MRIDSGHHNSPHVRSDFDHSLNRPESQGVQRAGLQKGADQKTSLMSHVSSVVTDLIGRLRDKPDVRPEEVQRTSEQVRLGNYDTKQAAQDVAAAILSSPDKFV